MDICSNGHEEIVYIGNFCPFCTVIDEHKEKVERLEDEIASLKEEAR